MDATNFGWTSVRPESDEERFGMRSQERQAAFDKIPQWHLQRILAMSGAAGWREEAFDDDDDDDADGVPARDVDGWIRQLPESPSSQRARGYIRRSVTSSQARQAPSRLFSSLSNVTNLVHSISTPTRQIYVGTLRTFWKAEDVDAWSGQIFVDDNANFRGTETVANMISLTSTLHTFHTQGAFALRPVQISDDKKQLELEFHWLVIEKREKGTKAKLMDMPESSEDRTESGDGYGPFARRDPNGSQLLKSGHRFIMSTDDPLQKPLPDPGKLTCTKRM
ncbi:uncharacterized protein J4E78_002739 [Alternaria triticimaculans]|uniref:uncharacterized protein n=1 Tax=Alternaria triticimaculans TaxID=297637 RepID=UPI0020C455BE|nr:uncharacterized protein J4E78_002739 [Alternaria triticimaculans]KAI4665279.1 hypothetical protein J4E78_002739 [Alternaria triticimaculans]